MKGRTNIPNYADSPFQKNCYWTPFSRNSNALLARGYKINCSFIPEHPTKQDTFTAKWFKPCKKNWLGNRHCLVFFGCVLCCILYVNKTCIINYFLSPSTKSTKMHVINYHCNIRYSLFNMAGSKFFTIFLLFYQLSQNYTDHELLFCKNKLLLKRPFSQQVSSVKIKIIYFFISCFFFNLTLYLKAYKNINIHSILAWNYNANRNIM